MVRIIVAVLLLVGLEVCLWRIAEKCGLYGWEGIIPLYNIYAISSVIGQLSLGLCTIVFIMVPIITLGIHSPIVTGMNVLAMIGAATAYLLLLGMLCMHLKRSIAWVYCAVLLPFVFFPVMAFTD